MSYSLATAEVNTHHHPGVWVQGECLLLLVLSLITTTTTIMTLMMTLMMIMILILQIVMSPRI